MIACNNVKVTAVLFCVTAIFAAETQPSPPANFNADQPQGKNNNDNIHNNPTDVYPVKRMYDNNHVAVHENNLQTDDHHFEDNSVNEYHHQDRYHHNHPHHTTCITCTCIIDTTTDPSTDTTSDPCTETTTHKNPCDDDEDYDWFDWFF